MTSSEQLERETENARAQIVDSLTELRERLTPGRMMDEALDFARDGRAGQFVRNLGRQASDNPLSVALIGAGLAWLMMGGQDRHTGARTSASASRAVSDATGAASGAGQQAMQAGSDIKNTASEMASDFADSARRTAHDWTDGAGAAASNLASRTGSAASGVASFLKEEPLVLAGLGVALGAILGSVFPASEAENRLMGETSDALKEDATEAAGQQWEKGKEAMEKVWGGDGADVKQETEAPGLVAE
jgi:hypothetical protein